MTIQLPPRYTPVSRLGKGGGGEVWAVKDCVDDGEYALKTLAEGASESEVMALVREASSLSGLEGLGLPRVLRFGRLPRSHRPYLLRDLVKGQSLADQITKGMRAEKLLAAVLRAADQLTRIHRAGLLHGDIKPANIIADESGQATLVDLGLAAPWREKGQYAVGLTPGYAAPELYQGARLTVRAEVYSLGATLRDVLESAASQLGERAQTALLNVVRKATAVEPAERYPSVDELATTLRQGLDLPASLEVGMADAAWPVLGLDGTIARLLLTVSELPTGGVLVLRGRVGSGRTALLRRLAWSLGVEGRAVAWIEGASPRAMRAVEAELAGASPFGSETVLLLDDADKLPESALSPIRKAQKQGARIVLCEHGPFAEKTFGKAQVFVVPPLDTEVAASLVRRAIPSISDAIVTHIVARAEGRPGRLRAIVRTVEDKPVVGTQDVDRALDHNSDSTADPASARDLGGIIRLLDQGRLNDAATALSHNKEPASLALAVAKARLFLGRGDAESALRELDSVKAKAQKNAYHTDGRAWQLYRARAMLRQGNYSQVVEQTNELLQKSPRTLLGPPEVHRAIEADALACRGVAETFLGQKDKAFATLASAVEKAKESGDRRVASVALGSLALALQRWEQLGDAKHAYEEALEAAEDAGDAGAVATTRLNLAALTHGQGDIAEALTHLEAAVDMGRRAGREGTVQQALLNLANLDLYLGRIARAEANIEALVKQKDRLSAVGGQIAQLTGLQAELAARKGESERAALLYEACATAYEATGRAVDAAEARIEAVIVAARANSSESSSEPASLQRTLDRAAQALGDTPTHRAALALARSAVATLSQDESRARQYIEEALTAAAEVGQKEWTWRALESRARLELENDRTLAARKDAEQAVAVLEDIAVKLPRDLREVYWNDPRRASIRSVVQTESKHLAVRPAVWMSPTISLTTQIGMTTPLPADDRLGRILEINRELATVHDLAQILDRVVDHAIALLQAERGYILLVDNSEELQVHAARSREGEEHSQRFSKSVAARTIATGEPFVSLTAREDARLLNHESIHLQSLQSVACVPIRTPKGRSIGALYLETRARRGSLFEREIFTLKAFADQAAIAIETARLHHEDEQQKAELARANQQLEKTNVELASANTELSAARSRLEELLSAKTAQLESTKRDLKDTRAVLRGHFGYQGLVGTSAAMRKVYALVDRVKDTDIPVLITGESGTGKEVVARAIHQGGPRAKRPFSGVNCGAIPANLLESELFGHIKGAFTGADRDRKGLFREAEGGTLLLDEIGEMPLKMQAGLLRVLQEKVVRPVGGTREEPIDVRVIAATHRSLAQMIQENLFREDLYYRLRVVEVNVPPLRDRPEDIPALIDHFLNIFSARYRRERGSVSRDALRLLMANPWPGNVRQLENTLLNAWVLSDNDELSVDDFDLTDPTRPASIRPSASTPVSVDAPNSMPASKPASSAAPTRYADHLAREKERILRALEEHNWNRAAAAQALDIPRRTFYRRLKEFGIQ